ncbi:type II restriction enzyme [Flexibacter flexilis DSM 6793]|uniref:Type II restriction enzyme n=1 Tax=Flexibacter flexilis DSM 6793 TaxID=927664 RepID=A0A1I1FKR8_9BACT|nr:HaeII family restriction endonuclease [Flexibacter flexilis]SFB97713.1 type II restriction enzyme [Flexibacter flexilis DSM 6793]
MMKAKNALDKVIEKARVHLYKPIQIAEILYRDRVEQDINLQDLATYRTTSKKWRDIICLQFLGRTSTSSARYQDDIFNENAIPPSILVELGKENKQKNGIIEAYIYQKFAQRFSQMSAGLDYCQTHDKSDFQLDDFLAMFWNEAGLRRSIDKIYEIVVYALFSALVEALEVSVEVSFNPDKAAILSEFEDFAYRVIQLSTEQKSIKLKARINRVGVTNAADRGLDMWANFGLAIQIKHLSLTEELAENIVSSVSADRIVIVCKDSEQKIILSVLNQIGWKSRVQSIITETDLLNWYEKALRGKFAYAVGDNILTKLREEIQVEFPATDNKEFQKFMSQRGYDKLFDSDWNINI